MNLNHRLLRPLRLEKQIALAENAADQQLMHSAGGGDCLSVESC